MSIHRAPLPVRLAPGRISTPRRGPLVSYHRPPGIRSFWAVQDERNFQKKPELPASLFPLDKGKGLEPSWPCAIVRAKTYMGAPSYSLDAEATMTLVRTRDVGNSTAGFSQRRSPALWQEIKSSFRADVGSFRWPRICEAEANVGGSLRR
jgi:hypothetical protein